MRVLETETTQSGYNMGKNKKHKLRKTKEASESSDDGTSNSTLTKGDCCRTT